MLFLTALFILVPAGQIAIFLSSQWLYDPLTAIDFAASLAALHWMLGNAIIAAKVPVLQKLIPYDRRIQFHVFSSAAALLAVTWHAVFRFARGSYINPVTWKLLVSLSVFFIIAIMWIPVPGFRRIRSAFRPPKYDRAKTIHRLLTSALATLLFLHVASAGVFATVPDASAALYLVLFVLALGLPILSGVGAFRRRTVVTGVFQRDDILDLELELPRAYRYRAGQFAFLRTRNANGRMEEHPFSFLSTPDEDRLRFGIRNSGDFTEYLTGLKVGEPVEVSRPFGNFRPPGHGRVCLIGSGVGTVPIVSILKEMVGAGQPRSVLAFLAVSNQGQILDRAQLEEIRGANNGMDVRVLVYDDDGIQFSEEFFRGQIREPEQYSYYLCSSPRVRTIVTDALGALGVSRKRVRFEAFSLG
jgi:predicted ferric reductase